MEHLLYGLTDLGTNAVARYERDCLGFGIARGWDICNFVARLQMHVTPVQQYASCI